jgi:hypothetical protein
MGYVGHSILEASRIAAGEMHCVWRSAYAGQGQIWQNQLSLKFLKIRTAKRWVLLLDRLHRLTKVVNLIQNWAIAGVQLQPAISL